MKKSFWILFLLGAVWLPGRAQDNSDDQNSDDVYYQGDDNSEAQPAAASDQDQSAPTYQEFYDQLSPYGQWINYPGYGYCWVPNQLPPDFSPYLTGGHWVYTDFGMTWASDYPWGWATFHYGRWFDDPTYGWMWVPGYDWGPAWCMWGEYGGYYCWAPIGPGVVISPHYRPDPHWWHFCERGHIMDEHFDHFVVRNDEFENKMHVGVADINNHISYSTHASTYKQGVFFSGPKAEEIQRYSGHPVAKMTISNSDRPGATRVANNQVNIYRPNIQRTSKQPAPAHAKNVQDLHPSGAQPGNEQGHGTTQEQRPAEQSHGQVQHSQPAQQAPREVQQPRPAQQVQHSQPAVRQQQPERDFIPSAPRTPAPSPQRSAPAPSFRGAVNTAPSFHSSGGGGGGGGFHGGGGGRR